MNAIFKLEFNIDQGDKVDRINRKCRETVTAAARGIRPGATGIRASLSRCLDCGETIPGNRRNAVIGCKRCIECENEQEHRTGQDNSSRKKQNQLW